MSKEIIEVVVVREHHGVQKAQWYDALPKKSFKQKLVGLLSMIL